VWGRRNDTAVTRHNNDDGDDNDNNSNNNNNNSNLLGLHLQICQCCLMSQLVCTSNDG